MRWKLVSIIIMCAVLAWQSFVSPCSRAVAQNVQTEKRELALKRVEPKLIRYRVLKDDEKIENVLKLIFDRLRAGWDFNGLVEATYALNRELLETNGNRFPRGSVMVLPVTTLPKDTTYFVTHDRFVFFTSNSPLSPTPKSTALTQEKQIPLSDEVLSQAIEKHGANFNFNVVCRGGSRSGTANTQFPIKDKDGKSKINFNFNVICEGPSGGYISHGPTPSAPSPQGREPSNIQVTTIDTGESIFADFDVWVEPTTAFSSLSATNSNNSTRAVLASDLNYGARIGYGLRLQSRFKPYVMYELDQVTYIDPQNYTLTRDSSLTHAFRIGSKYEFKPRWHFNAEGGLRQNRFLSVPSTQILSEDQVWIPFAGVSARYQFLSIWSSEWWAELGADLLLPGSTDTYSVNIGRGLYGKILGMWNVSGRNQYGLSFGIYSQDQSTSLGAQEYLRLGLEVFGRWSFGSR